MSTLAFTQTQAEFLTLVADARPRYWEYECRVKILDAHQSGTLAETLESLTEVRNQLKRGILELPPARNLSQHISQPARYQQPPEPPQIVMFRVGNDGQRIYDFLPFSGNDPMAWLLAAYENATELLQITEELITVCLQAPQHSTDEVLFTLDPPLHVHDARIAILQRWTQHFKGLTAADVLRIFDTRHGELVMQQTTKWKNALIVESIRKGLGLQPRVLRHVYVQHDTGDHESWLTDGDPPQNRFGMHVNSARSKGFDEFHSLEEEALELTQALSQIVSL